MNYSRMPVWADPAAAVIPEQTPSTDGVAARGYVQHTNGKVSAPSSPPREAASGDVKVTVMSFRNIHEHGTLLAKYLEARKAIFIDRLKWHVAEADGMEFDQYDTPACRWVILHEFGEIVGGVRLLPTTARCGTCTYMLRDAKLGILPDLPTDVLFTDPPVDPQIWEASRFFITDLVPAARRAAVQEKLFNAMTTAAAQEGARHILGIVPSIWSRWARRIGVGAIPIGAQFSVEGMRNQSVLFSINGIDA